MKIRAFRSCEATVLISLVLDKVDSIGELVSTAVIMDYLGGNGFALVFNPIWAHTVYVPEKTRFT